MCRKKNNNEYIITDTCVLTFFEFRVHFRKYFSFDILNVFVVIFVYGVNTYYYVLYNVIFLELTKFYTIFHRILHFEYFLKTVSARATTQGELIIAKYACEVTETYFVVE